MRRICYLSLSGWMNGFLATTPVLIVTGLLVVGPVIIGAAILVPRHTATHIVVDNDGTARWLYRRFDSPLGKREYWCPYEALLASPANNGPFQIVASRVQASALGRTPGSSEQVIIDTYGWPLEAFQCEAVIATSPTDTSIVSVKGGLQISPFISASHPLLRLRVVPYAPIWVGMLGNSLAIGCGVMGIRALVRAVIRNRRTRMGLCPCCAYSLQGSASRCCPECGWNRRTSSTCSPT